MIKKPSYNPRSAEHQLRVWTFDAVADGRLGGGGNMDIAAGSLV